MFLEDRKSFVGTPWWVDAKRAAIRSSKHLSDMSGSASCISPKDARRAVKFV